ncbi:hypothetical protein NCC49_003759 [Naganishia albida]|nr:hypothetical protein NCC49_003759 [Naganishia albida]
MASSVQSFLFSPPSSPTAIERTHSPLLEPVESFNALNRLLTPRQGGPSSLPESDKKSTPTLAGEEFPYTRPYPSRSASPVGLGLGHELPPFPASSSSYQARPSAPVISRHNSFSDPINLPTAGSLPTPATHRAAKPWSHGRSKTILRAVMLAMFVLGMFSFFRPASLPSLGDSLSTSRMRQELLDVERISMVGGKKVRVTGQRGAPRTLMYAEQQEKAIAPARTYRPVTSTTPLTSTQELLALQSYLLSDPHHSIPETTDTSRPMDPMSLVGFKANDAQGWTELRAEVEPVVIWSIGSTWTTPVHELLALYSLLPGPTTLSLETRHDQAAIKAILARVVDGRSQDSPAPLITIGGKPIDGYAPLLKLHSEGRLHALLERAGAIVDGKRARDELDRARRARLGRMKQARIVVEDDE